MHIKTVTSLIRLPISPVLFLLLAFYASSSAAQAKEDSLLLRDYRYVQQSSPWLTGRNAAALTQYQRKNIAEAELSLSYGGGQLTVPGGADKVLQVNAAIESYYRISRRTVAYGAMSYNNWSGREMTGSVFMTQRMPFDIVEDSLTNAGRKHQDSYHLTGGFGVDVWNGYSVGVRLDYTAANYAKYKDLRHKNKLMDLSLTAGVFAPLLPWLKAGADYTYHRHTESANYNTYGKNEKVYKSLIDYGAFMGIVEQYGNDGFTDKSREMPYFEDSHSGALQVELLPLRHLNGNLWQSLSVYGNVTLTHGTGYYGRRSPYTIAYTNHKRDIVTANLRLSLETSTSRHLLDLSYSDEKVQNKQENFRAVNNVAGSPYYEYYDATETADKRWYNLNADYTLYLGVRGEQPTWTITAGYHWQKRNIAAYLYPFYRRQILTTNEVAAGVARAFMTERGVWTVMLNGAYQKGTGDPFVDGTFTTPAASQQAPATMEAFLYQDHHLLTSPQWRMGLQLKYAFRFPGTRLKTHVRGAFDYRKANTLTNGYCGHDYTTGALAVGCSF